MIIEKLAELLGVRLNEEFKLRPKTSKNVYKSRYRITENGMEFQYGYPHWRSVNSNFMQLRIFHSMLRGYVLVVKNEP